VSVEWPREPLIVEEHRRIRIVLSVGFTGGVAIWICAGELAGVLGVYVLIVVCVLVGAATARAVGA
jgi:hypothetical protein